MQLKFSHTTKELVDLYVFNTWSAPWRKKNRQRIGFIIPLSFSLFAASFLIDGSSIALGIIFLVMAGLWLIFYNTIYTKRLQHFAKGYYNHQVNERFWVEHTYDFKEDAIHLKNEFVEAKIQWKAIVNVIEENDVFWLFETLTAAHIIPKRLMSEQEQQQFKQMLATKLLHN